MHVPLPLFLGLRYAIARRRRGFVSFISAVAMLGLTLGTAVLIVVLSVLNGFERELRERVLGVVPQLLIERSGGFPDWSAAAATLATVAGVRAVAPLVGGPVLIATRGGVRAAELSGVMPAAEAAVSIVPRFVQETTLDALVPGRFEALLGVRLAAALHVRPGEFVSVVLPQMAVTPLGVFPRQKRFRVIGLLQTGAELDDRSVYVHIADAQRLYQVGGSVTALRLRVDDLFAVAAVGQRAIDALTVPPPERALLARDWTQTLGGLYRAILLQRTTMLVLLSLVIAVAAFNVVASLVMIVTDKQGEIAILRSLGLSTRAVMASFVWLGTFVGLVGIGTGAAAGVVLSLWVERLFGWLQGRWHLHFLDQYFIHYLPSQLRWHDVLLVGGIALVLTMLASLYPAWRAARVLPAEVLRYE